jgi:hypothetical protein
VEIKALHLVVTVADLNAMLRQWMPRGAPVRKLRIGVSDKGVKVTGEAKVPVPVIGSTSVSFETEWRVSVKSGKLVAELANLAAAGIPAGMLKSTVIGLIREALRGVPGVSASGETLRVNLDALLEDMLGVSAKVNVASVVTEAGKIVIRAG